MRMIEEIPLLMGARDDSPGLVPFGAFLLQGGHAVSAYFAHPPVLEDRMLCLCRDCFVETLSRYHYYLSPLSL